MNSIVLSLPFSFMIALLVSKVALIALNLPVEPVWVACSVVIGTLLLYKRNLVELGLIAVIAMFAEVHSTSMGNSAISPDVLLSLLIAIIVLPATLGMMGIAPLSTRSNFRAL